MSRKITKYVIEEEEEDENLATFDNTDLEFDDYGVDLEQGEYYDEDNDEDWSRFCTGRMTPDGLIEDDFEEELGCVAQEMNVQDVIDADYADISKLGILQLAGDDQLGRKVIVFSACRLPATDQINHQRLLEYLKRTLEQYVAGDYTLVYFHFGFSSRNKPSVKWILQAYKDFDRNFKKNLKNLFLVHPTGFIKFMWNLFRPFISVKFGRKVMYVNHLKELQNHFYIDQLPIPQRVRDYDDDLTKTTPEPSASKEDKFNDPEYDDLNAHSFEKEKSQKKKSTPSSKSSLASLSNSPYKVFGVSLEETLALSKSPIPLVMEKCISYLQIKGLEVEGVFLRSVSADTIKRVKDKFNKGEIVDFKDYGDNHVPAVILKIFLRQLEEPLLTFSLYDEIVKIHNLPLRNKIVAIKRLIMDKLPQTNYDVLNYLIGFLTEVAAHSSQNHMTAISLGVVFGSNLMWSKKTMVSLNTMGYINNFVQLLITNFDDIFVK